MRVLSLFSGAGGGDLAVDLVGGTVVALCEIEPHARAVLRHQWPHVPLHDDVTTLDGTAYRGRVDCVIGGSPCQDLSVAGKRAGMTEGSGTRSSLYYEQIRIWRECDAPFLVWENVLGALSSNAGEDFAAVLAAVVGCSVRRPTTKAGRTERWARFGHVSGPDGDAAWCVLDAQYFGLAQRRTRVFVVGARAGCGLAVHALAESLRGRVAALGKAGEGAASDAAAGAASERGGVTWPALVAPTLNAAFGAKQGLEDQHALHGAGLFVPTVAFHMTQDPVSGPISPTLGTTSQGMGVAHTLTGNGHDASEDGTGRGTPLVPWVSPTLDSRAGKSGETSFHTSGGLAITPNLRVRRLTPRECERLMGWPDDHTRYGVVTQEDRNCEADRLARVSAAWIVKGYPKKAAIAARKAANLRKSKPPKSYELKDGPRYKLCGNGIATPCLAWVLDHLISHAQPLRVAA